MRKRVMIGSLVGLSIMLLSVFALSGAQNSDLLSDSALFSIRAGSATKNSDISYVCSYLNQVDSIPIPVADMQSTGNSPTEDPTCLNPSCYMYITCDFKTCGYDCKTVDEYTCRRTCGEKYTCKISCDGTCAGSKTCGLGHTCEAPKCADVFGPGGHGNEESMSQVEC